MWTKDDNGFLRLDLDGAVLQIVGDDRDGWAWKCTQGDVVHRGHAATGEEAKQAALRAMVSDANTNRTQ